MKKARTREEIAALLTTKYGKSMSVDDVADMIAGYEEAAEKHKKEMRESDDAQSLARLTVDRAMGVIKAKENLLFSRNVENARLKDDVERETACAFRAFVSGAKWWEFEKTGGTMWGSDVAKAERAARARYPFKGPYIEKLEEALKTAQDQLTAVIGECLLKECANCDGGKVSPDVCNLLQAAKDALARIRDAQKPRTVDTPNNARRWKHVFVFGVCIYCRKSISKVPGAVRMENGTWILPSREEQEDCPMTSVILPDDELQEARP
jgi:hypothetical protein